MYVCMYRCLFLCVKLTYINLCPHLQHRRTVFSMINNFPAPRKDALCKSFGAKVYFCPVDIYNFRKGCKAFMCRGRLGSWMW